MTSTSCDLILKGAQILVDSETTISQGAVAIAGGKIQAVGSAQSIESEWQAKEVRDLGNVMIMPGLVNAHTHVPMTFLRGFADDLPLMEWLNNHVFPVEHHLTKEIVALGARWGMYEMMRTGTTALVDSYLHEESVLSTADQMGMRCIGGEALYAFPSPAYGNLDEAMDLYRDQARRYQGRVQVALMPHSVYTTSDEILRRCVEVSEELDIMIHIHLSESAKEVEDSEKLHDGLRPVAYAESLGFLSERTFLAHMVDLEDEEIKLVAQRGAQVIHNPVSNLKLASGIAEVKKMRDAGISVALGTDGACSNNSLDMFESMKLAAILAKGHTKDATVLPANEALKMATEESARIFRTPGLGTLRPNAPADLIALDLDEPNLNPIFNPTSHAVYAASGKDCVLTMVEGRILYDHGVYTDGQYAETRGAICELVNWVQKQAKKG
jgi:5-methylthioadenosine/S-adenosylhomocysteine deaminase